MTTNVGTEYINVKNSKYNRSVRSGYSYNTASVSGEVRRKSVPVSGERSLAGEIAEEVLNSAARAVARKRKERANAPAYIKKYVKEKKSFPVSVIGYILVFSILAASLVMGNCAINEATLYADSLKSEITQEIDRGELLSAALTKRLDSVYIEDYATNVLGMVKSTDVAKRYVSISGEEKIVVSADNTVYSDTFASLTLNAVN